MFQDSGIDMIERLAIDFELQLSQHVGPHDQRWVTKEMH